MLRRVFNYLWYGDENFYDDQHRFAHTGVDRWLWISIHLLLALGFTLVILMVIVLCLSLTGVIS